MSSLLSDLFEGVCNHALEYNPDPPQPTYRAQSKYTGNPFIDSLSEEEKEQLHLRELSRMQDEERKRILREEMIKKGRKVDSNNVPKDIRIQTQGESKDQTDRSFVPIITCLICYRRIDRDCECHIGSIKLHPRYELNPHNVY